MEPSWLSRPIPGIDGKSPHGVLLGPQEVARPLVAKRQGYASVRVLGSVQRQRCRSSRPLSSWPRVHIAEAQVVEKVGVLGIQAEEFIQVDAGLVELAGGEELVDAGEVVGHGYLKEEGLLPL